MTNGNIGGIIGAGLNIIALGYVTKAALEITKQTKEQSQPRAKRSIQMKTKPMRMKTMKKMKRAKPIQKQSLSWVDEKLYGR